MEEAKFIAVGWYRPVLEDRPEICDSESSNEENSDHSEELSGMYTSGCPSLAESAMTEEQAERLGNRENAGGNDTVSGEW
jgi:hypothetical protein